jgi:glycosyltransferase involved in cell wall biosynthesis
MHSNRLSGPVIRALAGLVLIVRIGAKRRQCSTSLTGYRPWGQLGHGGPFMPTIGYVPFKETARSYEAEWIRDYLGVDVHLVNAVPPWNHDPAQRLPTFDRLTRSLQPLLPLSGVVLEGPGAFLWAACLRALGFAGSLALLPGVNPRGWRDVLAVAVYRHFQDRRDRVFVGSRPSAAVYAALAVEPDVGDPYGIDERLFRLRPEADRVRSELGIPNGRLLLHAGRARADRDLNCFLQVGLKARLLFPDLVLVVAGAEEDGEYSTPPRGHLDEISGVHFVVTSTPRQLADLFNIADVFLESSTSRPETFGRIPAQALICGCPTVTSRYDGFAEVLAQPGGRMVDPTVDPADGTPQADEAGLLRAVYDTLTTSRGPAREDIADAARRRFGRSYTMGRLRTVVEGAPRRPGSVPPARLRLPGSWPRKLTDLAEQKPDEALAWCWNEAEHDRLARHDDEFRTEVRRSLCVPAAGGPRAARG